MINLVTNEAQSLPYLSQVTEEQPSDFVDQSADSNNNLPRRGQITGINEHVAACMSQQNGTLDKITETQTGIPKKLKNWTRKLSDIDSSDTDSSQPVFRMMKVVIWLPKLAIWPSRINHMSMITTQWSGMSPAETRKCHPAFKVMNMAIWPLIITHGQQEPTNGLERWMSTNTFFLPYFAE